MAKLIIAKVFSLALEFILKHGKNYLENNIEFNKLLNDLGLEINQKDNYRSVYIRTLLILEGSKEVKKFLKIFLEDEVFQSFEKADKNSDRDIFVREINSQLHTNPRFRSLKEHNEIPSLVVSEFFVTFNRCIKDNWSPTQAKTFKILDNIQESAQQNSDQITKTLSEVSDFKRIYLADRGQNINSEKLNASTKARLDLIFESIKSGNLESGNNKLVELKDEIWSDISNNEIKNSILKKIAYCFLEKKDFSNSAKYYEEALQFKNDPGTLSTLALIYHQSSDKVNFNTVLTKLEKTDQEKAEISKIRFGLSSKPPNIYYESFLNGEIEDEETLLALIQYFAQSSDFKKAFEIGDKLIQLFNKIEYKEFTSSFSISHLQYKGIHMGLEYLNKSDKEIFRKGLKYISDCGDFYKGKEIEKYKVEIFANRSIYETWNRNFDLAKDFITYAISLDDKNFYLIKILGVIYIRKNDYTEALNCFEKIPDAFIADLEDIPLLKSVCLLSLNKTNEALNELEASYRKIRDLNIKQRTIEQLINLCFLSKNIEKAKSIFQETRGTLPEDYQKIIQAKILNLEGSEKEGLAILDELKLKYKKSKEFSPIVPDLGNEYSRINELNSAIELYEAFANYADNTFFVRALFELYVNSQQYEKAIKICEAQRKTHVHEFYTEYEIAIYLEYLDYEKVVELAEEFLSQFPNNIQVRLNLIYSEYKLGNIPKAKDHIKYPFKIDELNERNNSNLVDLHIKLNQKEEALELAYKLLAINQNAFYSNLFLKVSFLNDDFLANLKKSTSNKNHSIEFLEGKDEKVITLVEKSKQDCFTYFSEVPQSDRMYHKLLTCEVGQTVNISNKEKIIIKKILHKYVYAFQTELQNANTIYKSESFIKTFDASPLKHGILPKEMQEIISSGQEAQIKFDEFFKQYNEGRIPLISLSKKFGKQLIDIWLDTSISHDKFISVCSGIKDEMELGLKIIKESKKELLLDITSLLLIYRLDIIDILNKHFNIYVIQDALDYLDNYLSLNAISETLRTIEIENLLVWTKANIKIYPPNFFLKTDQNAIAKYSEILGQATSKNIVLAANKDLIYLCDDLALRNLFTSEFKKPALWTQCIIQYLSIEKYISDETYFELLSKLIQLNIKHTHISGAVIFSYFNKTNYHLTNNSLKLLRVLRGDYSDNSAFTVAFSFLFNLWKSETEIEIKEKITFEVFWHLSIYRVFIDVDNSIIKLLSLLFTNPYKINPQWQKVKYYLGIIKTT